MVNYIMANEAKEEIGQVAMVIPEVFIFNRQATVNVFCFPPALAYGIAYKKLAERLPGYRFYAFNYHGGETCCDAYMERIVGLQQQGPYVLLGYSAGGALALEVAKRLERGGYEVADLIFLDTYRFRRPATDWEMLLEPFIREAMEGLLIDDAVTRGAIRQNIRDYYQYSNTLVSKGITNARLHLIRGADREKEEATVRRGLSSDRLAEFPPFCDLTRNKYIEYTGSGEHGSMLDDDHLTTNSTIIAAILATGPSSTIYQPKK
jgi:pimeloyl-ACP methyl ester carboxylesterase